MIHTNRQNPPAFILVNCVTLSRIPLSVLAYMELSAEHVRISFYLLFFFSVVITDFFDGKLARAFGIQSNFGAASDVFCDFFYVITSCYALYRQGWFPSWMLVLITVKLLEFVITSLVVTNRSRSRCLFIFDYIGRYTGISFYLLPTVILGFHRLLSPTLFCTVSYAVYGLLLFFSLFSAVQRMRVLVVPRLRCRIRACGKALRRLSLCGNSSKEGNCTLNDRN